MQFPNAAKGVKKIYISTVLEVLAVGLTGLSTILIAFYGFGLGADTAETAIASALVMAPGAVFAGIASTLGSIVLIVAIVFNLMGIVQASKDEEMFKTALYLILLGLGVGVVNAFFSNNELSTLFQIASDIVSLMVSVMIVNGISHLAELNRNIEVQERGQAVIRLMVLTLGVSVIIKIAMMLVGGLFTGLIGLMLVLAMVGLHIVYVIMYLVFLNRANRMLTE